MCGIVGAISHSNVAPFLIEGLRRLEYRGYDSSGIAVVSGRRLRRRRSVGKLAELERRLRSEPLSGSMGIGHTRWATHGRPTEANAHPHASAEVVIVHNGIIENHRTLREELQRAGCTFDSETDTEVIVHLLSQEIRRGVAPVVAIPRVLARLQGSYAIAALFPAVSDRLFAASRGCPLAIGRGEDGVFVGSDSVALAPKARSIAYLEDGDWAEIDPDGYQLYDRSGGSVDREIRLIETSSALVDKGSFPNFMLKEIYEQPDVLRQTLNSLIDCESMTSRIAEMGVDLASVPKVTLVACGTSFHAAQVAKYWLERVARVPAEVDIASEFRYRNAPMPAGGLAVFISQSGETADTLAALRYARGQGQYVVSIVNVGESSMARESDFVLRTLAGPEIGVASTKAFTTQLLALACLTIDIAGRRGAIDSPVIERLIRCLAEMPSQIQTVLALDGQIRGIAELLAKAQGVLYLGRGSSSAIASEGALKLKEISYIHAESYAAGELKHGPIALVDGAMPIVVVAPSDGLFDKTASNVEEVVARGGRVILFSDAEGVVQLGERSAICVSMPDVDPFVAPIVYAVPMQLLAYHSANARGTDVDRPRNLAKSVTVE